MGYRDDPGEGGDLRLYPGWEYSLVIRTGRMTTPADLDAVVSVATSVGVSVVDKARYAYWLFLEFTVSAEMDAYTFTSALSGLGYSVYPSDIKVVSGWQLWVGQASGAINDVLGNLPSIDVALPVGLLILGGIGLVVLSIRR